MVAVLALLVFAQAPEFSQATLSGVVVTDFYTPQGLVRIYLPDDMAAGDTVSGTVYVEPMGSNEEERDANLGLLQKMAVSIDGDAGVVTGTRLVLRPLSKGEKLERSLRVRVTDGREFSAPLQVGALRTDRNARFDIPDISPAGRPVLIFGPFDGDTNNTRADFGGKDAVVLAETPRGCVVQIDPSYVGPRKLILNEAGEQITKIVVLPRLTLSAPKTSLARGERTKLTVRVTGLEGLGASTYPIAIELTNRSPSVIEIEDPVNFGIESKDVRGGQWSRTIEVHALGQGAYVVTGLIHAVPLHDAKRGMSVTEFNHFLAGLRVMLAGRVQELEALVARGRVSAELQARVDRTKVAERLVAGLGTVADGVAKRSAAEAVDKALVDDSLDSLLTEMLARGHASAGGAPVGDLIRGAKAMSRRMPRVLAALERAERLHGEVESLSDPQQKLNRTAELRVALEAAQAAQATKG